MCDDWETGRLQEEARLERIRQGLVLEIEHVRQARREREAQGKRLEIAAEAPAL